MGGIVIVHGVRRSRKNYACYTDVRFESLSHIFRAFWFESHLIEGSCTRHQLGIDVELATSSGDQMAVLGGESEQQQSPA